MHTESAVAPRPAPQNVFISAAAGEEEVLTAAATIDGLEVKKYLAAMAGRDVLLADPETLLQETERLVAAIDQPIVRDIVIEALAECRPSHFGVPAVRTKFFEALQPFAEDSGVLNLCIEALIEGDEQPETIKAIAAILTPGNLSKSQVCEEKLHAWLASSIARALPEQLTPSLAAAFRAAASENTEGPVSMALVAAALHSYRRFHNGTGYVDALDCVNSPKCRRTLQEMANESIYPYMHESGPAHPGGTVEAAMLINTIASVGGAALSSMSMYQLTSHNPLAAFLGALVGLVALGRASDYLTHRYIMDRPTRKGLNSVQSARARELLART